MSHSKLIYFKVLLLGFASALVFGCTGGAASSSFGSSTNPTFQAPAGSSTGITDGLQFYVGIDSVINGIAHVHTDDSFANPCSISPTADSQDITCVIDTPEGELYNEGLGLKINVPPGMCRYFTKAPYWFYNEETGYGPSVIVMQRNYTNNVLLSSTCSQSLDSGGMTAPAPCPGFSNEVFVNPTDGTATCTYDRSRAGAANCCMGNYNYTINDSKFDTVSGLTSNTSSVQNLNWGGTYTSCIGGAGKTDWKDYSASGIPLTVVYPVISGTIEGYVVSAQIKKISSASTIGIANFYSTTSTPIHAHTGFGPVLTPAIPARTSKMPYFVDPIDDISGSKLLPGQDSYEYSCLDSAFEVRHRIRVYVRKWDTYQDYVNFITTAGAVSFPNRSGVEGTGCNGVIGPCNDFPDSDDLVNSVGSFTTTLADFARRARYFPYLSPK